MKDKNNLFFLIGGVVLIVGIICHVQGVEHGIHIALAGFILCCIGFFRLLHNPDPNIDMSKQPKPFHGDFADNPRAGLGCTGSCGTCMSSGGCTAMNQQSQRRK